MDVKQLREKGGISQEQLSKITGIPRDRISKWEQGKGSPKEADLYKLNMVDARLHDILENEIPEKYHKRIFQELEYGFKLQDYREANKLTYDQMAEIAEIPTEEYFFMERGNVDLEGAYLKQLWEKTGIKLPDIIFPDNNHDLRIHKELRDNQTYADRERGEDLHKKLEDMQRGRPSSGAYTTNYDNLLDVCFEMHNRLRRMEANLIETRHGVEMTQALSKANLFQSAKLELIATKPGQWTKKDHQSIVKDLDALTAKIFDGIGSEINQTSGV